MGVARSEGEPAQACALWSVVYTKHNYERTFSRIAAKGFGQALKSRLPARRKAKGSRTRSSLGSECVHKPFAAGNVLVR